MDLTIFPIDGIAMLY